MSEIRDSANIMQYGCEGGREPLGKSTQLCIPEFEDQLAVADSIPGRGRVPRGDV